MYGLVWAELMVNMVELGILQLEDVTLAKIIRTCKDGVAVHGKRYFWKDGIFYCKH